jgi:Domain of unknown function (DUF4177)
MANRYQYTVVELRERMIGGKMSGDKLENVLNEHAAQGWQLKAITSVEVKGRVGPGGVEGLLVTFERPVGCAQEHGTGTAVVDPDSASRVRYADRRPLLTESQSILLHRRTRLAARQFHRESQRHGPPPSGAC